MAYGVREDARLSTGYGMVEGASSQSHAPNLERPYIEIAFIFVRLRGVEGATISGANNLLRKIGSQVKFIPMTNPALRIGQSERSHSGLLTRGKCARKFLPRESSVTH
jgi:hypothetical protein